MPRKIPPGFAARPGRTGPVHRRQSAMEYYLDFNGWSAAKPGRPWLWIITFCFIGALVAALVLYLL